MGQPGSSTLSDPPQLPNWAEFATFCPRKKKKLDLRRQGGGSGTLTFGTRGEGIGAVCSRAIMIV